MAGISDKVKRLLWAASGGYCQSPSCRRELFPFFEDGTMTNIEECAHVIGRSDSGPRGESRLAQAARDEFANIILLCPACHTIIDKNPEKFPPGLLLRWKAEHQDVVRRALGAGSCSSRSELRTRIAPLLQRNREIHESLGPGSEFARDPLSEAVSAWRGLAIQEVIPNNRRVLDLLRGSEDLLTPEERTTVNRFATHVSAFEYNQLSRSKIPNPPRFPLEMNSLMEMEDERK